MVCGGMWAGTVSAGGAWRRSKASMNPGGIVEEITTEDVRMCACRFSFLCDVEKEGVEIPSCKLVPSDDIAGRCWYSCFSIPPLFSFNDSKIGLCAHGACSTLFLRSSNDQKEGMGAKNSDSG